MFLLILLIFVLVGGAMVVVSLLNISNQVQLSLYTMVTPYLPLGLLLLGSFILGAFLLYLFAVASARKERRELKKLRQRVKELEQASRRVPTGPLGGTPGSGSSPKGGMPPQGMPVPGPSGMPPMGKPGMQGMPAPQGGGPIVHMPGMSSPPQG